MACDCRICDMQRVLGNKAEVARQMNLPRSTVFDHLEKARGGSMIDSPLLSATAPVISSGWIDGLANAPYIPPRVGHEKAQGGVAPRLDDSLESGLAEIVRRLVAAEIAKTAPALPAALVPSAPAPTFRQYGGLVDWAGSPRTVVWLGDVHLPWCHHAALEAAFRYIEDIDPDVVLLGGDLHDCHSISRHEKDHFRTLQDELDESRSWIEKIDRLPGLKILLEGNHDARIRTFFGQFPALKDAAALDYRTVAGIPDSWDVFESQTHLRIGGPEGLVFLHGDMKCGPHGGKYLAEKLRDRLTANVIFGHHHRHQTAAHRVGPDGDPIWRGHAIGWLGDARACSNYITRPEWTVGFATAHFGADPGDFEVTPHIWNRGRYRIGERSYA